MINRPKILFFSDCHYFSGSEIPLIKFLESEQLNTLFDNTFVYRSNKRYTDGLVSRVRPLCLVKPLVLSDRFYPRRDKRFRFLPLIFTRASRLICLSIILPIFVTFDFISLRKQIKEIRPEILHINNGGYPGSRSARIAVIAARTLGIRNIVMVVNNQPVDYKSNFRKLEYIYDLTVAKYTSLFVSGSKQVANEIRKVLRLKEDQVVTIPNCSSLMKLHESISQVRHRINGSHKLSPYIFLAVGVLEVRKGHRFLIEAAADLVRQNPNLRGQFVVWIEGVGSEQAMLEGMIKNFEVADIVKILGSENNIGDVINAADCLVHPSIFGEDFSQVILDAMFLGKPVIANDLAGIPEQVSDSVTGVIIYSDLRRSLTEAFVEAINDPVKFAAFGIEGMKKYHRLFTPQLAVESYVKLYHSLLQSHE